MSSETNRPEGADVFHQGFWYRKGGTGYAEYWEEKMDCWRVSGKISNTELMSVIADQAQKEINQVLNAVASDFTALSMKQKAAWSRDSISVHSKSADKQKAIQLLENGAKVLKERGQTYSTDGEQERSFNSVSKAFNAITGKNITPAEVCLMLQILKDVRQWAQPNRLHEDSVIDGLNYSALKGEELYKQFEGANG